MAATLVITGFGQFGDVLENPSSQIVEKLKEILPERLKEANVVFRTLVVSVDATDAFHNEIECGGDNSTAVCVFLHIGVDNKGSKIKLEQCAYNNMTFRIPDHNGYQPSEECIDAHQECVTTFDEALYSGLPLTSMCEILNSKCSIVRTLKISDIDSKEGDSNSAAEVSFSSSSSSTEVPTTAVPTEAPIVDLVGGSLRQQESASNEAIVMSTDPGRYLCNYVYFKSLFNLKRKNREMKAVFVHVPPIEVISLDQQTQVIAALADLLINMG